MTTELHSQYLWFQHKCRPGR